MSLRILCSLLLAALIGREHAVACECKPMEVKEAARRADMVIVGVVVSVVQAEIQPADHLTRSGWFVLRAEVRVEQEIKGRMVADLITVYTALEAIDCGSELLTGQRYIIYGDRDPEFEVRDMNSDKPLYGRGTYWTNTCMRTRSYDEGEMDQLKAL